MNWEETVRLCPTTLLGQRINCDSKCHKAQAKITGDIAFKAGIKEAKDAVLKHLRIMAEEGVSLHQAIDILNYNPN